VKEEPLKLRQDFTLFQNERCIMKIFKPSLALPIMRESEVVGYVFHGEGKLVIDAVIETPRGAIGRPVEHKIETPFIMLAPFKKVRKLREELVSAIISDLKQKGYESLGEFIKAARELCSQTFRKTCFGIFPENRRHIFAFKREDRRIDLLVSKDDKLAYISGEKLFAFKRGKSVIIKPGKLLIAKSNRALVVSRS
jgi:hypothetical protein